MKSDRLVAIGSASVILLAIASCSDDGNGAAATIPGCSTLAGRTLTADEAEKPCRVDEVTADMLDMPVGEVLVAGSGSTLCENGRVLFWNDVGWGYEDGPFTIHLEGDGQTAPDVERDSCELDP